MPFALFVADVAWHGLCWEVQAELRRTETTETTMGGRRGVGVGMKKRQRGERCRLGLMEVWDSGPASFAKATKDAKAGTPIQRTAPGAEGSLETLCVKRSCWAEDEFE